MLIPSYKPSILLLYDQTPNLVELSNGIRSDTKLDLDLKLNIQLKQWMEVPQFHVPAVSFVGILRGTSQPWRCWVPGCGDVPSPWFSRVRHVDEEVRNYQGWCCSVALSSRRSPASPRLFFFFRGGRWVCWYPFFGKHIPIIPICVLKHVWDILRLTRTVRTVWLSNSMFWSIDDWHHGHFSNPHTSPYCSYCRIHHIPICLHIKRLDYIIYLELPNTGFLNSKPKKDRFWGLVWKKEHQSGFCRSWHFGRSGVEKSVQKAFKKR